jgi:hypothetical protein
MRNTRSLFSAKLRFCLLLSLSLVAATSSAQVGIDWNKDALTYRGDTATIVFSAAGGGLIDFRPNTSNINPLNWDSVPNDKGAAKPRPRGHFLCLDRWGAPSKSEQAKEMPFHGEASQVQWTVTVPGDGDRPQGTETVSVGQMTCVLPIAGLRVERTIRFQANSAVCVVTEKVSNEGRLGRVYNMVQHPSIAPPFLDESTIVDSNAAHGFSQAGTIPDSAATADRWPKMTFAESQVDLRYFHNRGDDGSDVSSFVFSDEVRLGWVTACNAGKGTLLGYLWKPSDYPWLNIWRHRQQSQVVARGLEFGTTGYHQPYAVLIKQHKILNRSLYEYIDADESQDRSYVAFVAEIPAGFSGVKAIDYQGQQIVITENTTATPRVIKLPLASGLWQ